MIHSLSLYDWIFTKVCKIYLSLHAKFWQLHKSTEATPEQCELFVCVNWLARSCYFPLTIVAKQTSWFLQAKTSVQRAAPKKLRRRHITVPSLGITTSHETQNIWNIYLLGLCLEVNTAAKSAFKRNAFMEIHLTILTKVGVRLRAAWIGKKALEGRQGRRKKHRVLLVLTNKFVKNRRIYLLFNTKMQRIVNAITWDLMSTLHSNRYTGPSKSTNYSSSMSLRKCTCALFMATV